MRKDKATGLIPFKNYRGSLSAAYKKFVTLAWTQSKLAGSLWILSWSHPLFRSPLWQRTIGEADLCLEWEHLGSAVYLLTPHGDPNHMCSSDLSMVETGSGGGPCCLFLIRILASFHVLLFMFCLYIPSCRAQFYYISIYLSYLTPNAGHREQADFSCVLNMAQLPLSIMYSVNNCYLAEEQTRLW